MGEHPSDVKIRQLLQDAYENVRPSPAVYRALRDHLATPSQKALLTPGAIETSLLRFRILPLAAVLFCAGLFVILAPRQHFSASLSPSPVPPPAISQEIQQQLPDVQGAWGTLAFTPEFR